MPSVSPPWIELDLLPQAARVSAAATAANSVKDLVVIRRIRRGVLSGRDRRPVAAAAVLFQDRAQPAHRPRALAAHEAPAAQCLADLVRQQLRLALEGEGHARGAARARLELVGPERADAVVLAGAP